MKTETSGQAAAARAGDAAPVDHAHPEFWTGTPGQRLNAVRAVKSQLSGGAINVLLDLAWFDYTAEHAFPSLKTLMATTGLARTSVVRALRELREKGVIEIVQGGGRGKPNGYRVLIPLSRKGSETKSFTGKVSETLPEKGSETKPFSDERVAKPAVKGSVSITERVSKCYPNLNDEDEIEDDRSASAHVRTCAREPGEAVESSSSEINPSSAPDGAGSATEADVSGSISLIERREAEWIDAGLSHVVASLSDDRADRIEALSDREWRALIAYVRHSEWLSGKSLAFITTKADQWSTTLDRAKKAAGGGPVLVSEGGGLSREQCNVRRAYRDTIERSIERRGEDRDPATITERECYELCLADKPDRAEAAWPEFTETDRPALRVVAGQ